MNAVQTNQHKNCYITIKGVNIYLDHTNERLKILDYPCISDNIIREIIDFAKDEGLGKIISNCRIKLLKLFNSNGFVIEGIINGFFQGEDAYCISYYIDPQRQVFSQKEEEDSILYQCLSDTKIFSLQKKHKYTIRRANVRDIPEMIKLFSTVFESYPSPVFSMEYLKKIMSEHVLFKLAEENGEIISIASADMDKLNLNAEITDCATYPEHRGRGILPSLIYSLEADLKEKGFRTAYSLSRAVNLGINKALSRLEYKYGGRLINNCHICGGYEDMNIWVKKLNED
ncbi:MAG: putative beta-lysine N-acetyltransferase [Firmicutes bacterium HGW-Firmicutes-15]|nr:MAG: putative beta-lysine N-acetyltransferase [Firmicutes bacterium HGW-Firmicutes-15]